ncbi:MAG: hypothetical protein COX81_00020 [Candidatus Magasanikbacteria bacterium CG_4_10_14_0_2_um_filter_37_12]|uniref:Rod shape-determining protein MreD n=1 Tax=Candidatus Magasanikbacteria bacterium CG_4_10_14_0_2_um_filter_37_12 TaxID=1974637 RepID=A0A2M7VAL3_9BACT|nr:MAG: hypothetical protein COX81_00020 [Candidatus Magasanikbacteria bacterium CG_4_10_14_0_2_um_filter_37_12]
MKNVLLFLAFFLIITIVVVVHISLSYFLVSPFSKINAIFIFLILFIFWKESGWVVWISFMAHFFVELFSLMPFGILLVSSTISILITYWLYTEVFTNHSWYAGSLLCASSLVIFRSLYALILFLSTFFVKVDITWGDLFVTFFTEILFTTITFIVIYFFFYYLLKKLILRVV